MRFLGRIINEFKNTGERPVLNKWFEEVEPVFGFAYVFAGEKASNKSILDFGCGGGYGSEYLSRFTKKGVVGFDIDKEVITTNSRFFSKIKNLSFTDKKSELGKYDLVVSFQLIEHFNLKSQAEYLKEIKDKHLKKDGLFLLSTVNKNITSYGLKKPTMPFHLHEFYPTELVKELKKYFRRVKIYGQMTEDMMKRAVSGKRCYNKDHNREIKLKILRSISQIEIIRRIARRTPLFIKSFIWGYKSNLKERYILVKDKNLIDNSYVLICECSR